MFEFELFELYPLVETGQAAPCRAIQGSSISVNSTLPPPLKEIMYSKQSLYIQDEYIYEEGPPMSTEELIHDINSNTNKQQATNSNIDISPKTSPHKLTCKVAPLNITTNMSTEELKKRFNM